MTKKTIVQSELHCKATAELEDSVIDDLLKTDGNLKELLDDITPKNEQHPSDTSSKKQSK